MAITHFHFPKPARSSDPVGFGSPAVSAEESERDRRERLRRRRELLESYFSPFVSPAAMPSTVDRLVLWRNHHGRHHG